MSTRHGVQCLTFLISWQCVGVVCCCSMLFLAQASQFHGRRTARFVSSSIAASLSLRRSKASVPIASAASADALIVAILLLDQHGGRHGFL